MRIQGSIHWYWEHEYSNRYQAKRRCSAICRRVAHALQEPLRLELEKLVDEGILHKLKIDEKSEWLNSFVCVRKPNSSIRLS